jgi:hypothetical protein
VRWFARSFVKSISLAQPVTFADGSAHAFSPASGGNPVGELRPLRRADSGHARGIKKRGEAEAALWGSLIRELKIEAD